MDHPFVVTGWRRGLRVHAATLVGSIAALFSAAPLSGQVAVDELELRLSLKRGALASEVFHATNASALPARATITVQDWDRSQSGENRYYPLGTLATSCGSRIKVFPSVLQLNARTTQTVRVSLDSGATAATGCYAILFVETPGSQHAAQGGGLVYSLRYGVKVYVEPEGALSGEIENALIEPAPRDSSAKQLTVCFHNSGVRQTTTRGKVEIRRTDNTLVTTIDVPEFPTLPGATRRLGVPLPALQRGRYVLLALLDYEGSEIAAGQVELEIP